MSEILSEPDSSQDSINPDVIVLEGITGILVKGIDGHPGVRFWVSQSHPLFDFEPGE